MVSRKINYNAKNQIISIEETRGNITTVIDADGKLLRTITMNEGAKDTINEYAILDDGMKEESIFYGENGVKDSQIPAYKNVYQNGVLIAKYEYNESGEIAQRQNIKDGKVESVTKYNNGVEGETVQLYTNTNTYSRPDKVFDKIIDPVKQNNTGDCWLLNGLSMLSKTEWGRQALNDAISIDKSTGNITIKFKHAYGETKEFVITPKELESAKQATRQFFNFDLERGDVVYVDGKEELRMAKNDSVYLDSNTVKDNITFVDKSGKRYIWTKDNLEKKSSSNVGPKYSSGDLTVLAIELAVEKSRAEAGATLDGGYYQEVVSLFSNIDNNNVMLNTDVVACVKATYTNSEKLQYERNDIAIEKLLSYIAENSTRNNSEEIIQKIKEIAENPERYNCGFSLKMSEEGLHAAQMLRLEEKNGKAYITYKHSWDDKAEITEELDSFVKNKLYRITILENKDYTSNIAVDSDTQIGSFKMGNKSNRTNFASAIAQLGQNPNFKPDIQKDGNNFVVTIKGEKIVITPNEIETAKLSGNYSTKDDDIPILEIATERYINKTRHKNTVDKLAHTNLEDVKIQDILNLFSDKELKPSPSRSLKDAAQKDGLKYAISQRYDESINGMRNTYYPIKEIKQAPNGKYLISVIQPEDTSIVITYTEEEYKRLFNIIEIYS